MISGPIADGDVRTQLSGLAFLAFAGFTEFCYVYRARLAFELGERVVHDLRLDVYRKLLEMPLSFFRRTQVGRLIGRITSDVDVVRVGVQDVAFIATVSSRKHAGLRGVDALLRLEAVPGRAADGAAALGHRAATSGAS